MKDVVDKRLTIKNLKQEIQDQKKTLDETRAAIDETSFESVLKEHTVLFCGNGSRKLQKFVKGKNALFSNRELDGTQLAILAQHYYDEKKFADLAYTEPAYLKAFYSAK